MPIPFSCESCGRSLNVRDELAGQQIYCPDCKSILTVPNWSPPLDEEIPAPEPPPPQDDFAARAEELPPEPAVEEPPRPLPIANNGPRIGAIIVGLVMLGIAAAILIFQLDAGQFNRGATRLMVFLFIAGIAALIKGATGSTE